MTGPVTNMAEALYAAETVEIDGIYVGRNWSFNDQEDPEEAVFDASYVDDDTLDKYEWFFDGNCVNEAAYINDYWWIMDSSGQQFAVRLFKRVEVKP